MQNKPQVHPKSNFSFSFCRKKSTDPRQFKRDFQLCSGFGLLERAITKVVWSPSVFFDGIRGENSFAFSDFMALDFDDGQTIAEIQRAFEDSAYLIATTRSHLKEKKGVVAERFRLVVPWEERIRDLPTYRASIGSYIDRFEADQACKDGARFFWPCVQVIAYQPPADGLELASITAPKPPKEYQPRRDAISGKRLLPRHIVEFLTVGTVFGEGRNVSCFITAKELCEGGISEAEALEVINNSPFDRTGFRECEIQSAVRSAFKKG